MGMYLSVAVIYGVAWDGANVPSAAYPTTEDGEYRIEDGEAVYGDRLVWGGYGHTSGPADRYLAVCRPYAPTASVGRYAERVPTVSRVEMYQWDAWVQDYCHGLGIETVPVPGWLAIASFG